MPVIQTYINYTPKRYFLAIYGKEIDALGEEIDA